ncbi:prepilin-type N-terminal cleavage/methylation domain-containing protein [Alteromonas sp. 5E99-2]|uniref:PilW family protein n=1 Tax=Alteromonas sp. 5E99-2 TaxID=2817683 RepID=UPI001A9A1004|nr:prepilin-type N-terminal cleavage/methylation domain-containing protein [Alteromonas sp. 5E99-2]MBO1255807.1 prepilin-type N-terminal cleavage/methylation domain-containing protein [Alteromonas sp. 5E99-2]
MNKGFTLVELMIAIAISSFLVLAVSLSYSSIKTITNTTTELENAQEVLRYTSQIFIRSMKQTQSDPTVDASGETITVQQSANSLSCIGTTPTTDFTETFTLSGDNRLTCDIGAGAQDILRGLTQISFNYNNATRILTVNVSPEGLPLNYGGSVTINIAASTLWLNDYFGNI